METVFFTLQEYITHTKAVAYVLMAIGLIGFVLFWLFLSGRDEKQRKY